MSSLSVGPISEGIRQDGVLDRTCYLIGVIY